MGHSGLNQEEIVSCSGTQRNDQAMLKPATSRSRVKHSEKRDGRRTDDGLTRTKLIHPFLMKMADIL